MLGKPTYDEYGFRQVGEVLKIGLQKYGGTGEFLMANWNIKIVRLVWVWYRNDFRL